MGRTRKQEQWYHRKIQSLARFIQSLLFSVQYLGLTRGLYGVWAANSPMVPLATHTVFLVSSSQLHLIPATDLDEHTTALASPKPLCAQYK